MPELPEVETIRTQLQTHLPLRIDHWWRSSKTQRLIKQVDQDLTRHTITQIQRYGKWLIFILEQNIYIVSHLGMSGTWRVSPQPLNLKHGHIELKQDQPSLYLTYEDPRRFGHFYVFNQTNYRAFLKHRPPDIKDANYDLECLTYSLWCLNSKPLKEALLDQKHFAGIGNYLASEICARAGVLPFRSCGDLLPQEIEHIFEAIKIALDQAIATGGTTFGGGYRDTTGDKGQGVKNLVVFYQNVCRLCLSPQRQTKVIKITLGGRGTYYCPHCQK